MDWFLNLLFQPSAVQAMIVIALICAIGITLGKVRIAGISLGVTFVFFIGIIFGHLGFAVNHDILVYAENLGLVVFVYALGLQVGPGFFSSMSHGGIRLNLLGLGLALFTLALAISLTFVLPISIQDMMGIFSGATTCTPVLGCVQQTLSQLDLPASSPALGCAVSYPLGVVGVIFAIILMRKCFIKPSEITSEPMSKIPKPNITEFDITNPGLFGHTVEEIGRSVTTKFVISRLWHNGVVSIPKSDSVLSEGDRILVISSPDDVAALTMVFGEQEKNDWNRGDIDWNEVDRKLISSKIIVTKSALNGKTLGSLRLRNLYGVNVSRVIRSGMPLLASPDLRLQLGDRIIIVGEKEAIDKITPIIGNRMKVLDQPNLFALFIGIVLGVTLGSIPIAFPGISVPLSLGLAGGPIIMGILVGTFGPRLHVITYTTVSANLMLRGLGLAVFLACLGLDSGSHFFETVFRAEGLLWIGTGFVLTFVPIVLAGLVAVKIMKMDFGTAMGALCGSNANPMALDYANETLPGDRPSVAYATVYPFAMFTRVILVQIILVIMLI